MGDFWYFEFDVKSCLWMKVWVWCNSNNLVGRFYGGIPLVYALMQQWVLKVYPNTLILIQNSCKVEWVMWWERQKVLSLKGLTLCVST